MSQEMILLYVQISIWGTVFVIVLGVSLCLLINILKLILKVLVSIHNLFAKNGDFYRFVKDREKNNED